MWRGFATQRSTSTRSSPKLERASRRAASSASPKLGLGLRATHPLAAAARDRLHQHRKADPAGVGEQCGIVLILPVVAGDHGHAGVFHHALGRVLEAHRADRTGRWADEDDAGGVACIDKRRALGQEPVSRMHRIRAGCGRRREHPFDIQIALRRGRRAEPPRLAGHGHVQRVPVRIRVDRDGADAEPVRGAHHPAGDLASVGDEKLPEHQGRLPHIAGEVRTHHMRNTPKRVSSIGAFNAADRERASTSRLWAGWTMPSSHSRALA